MNKHSVSGNSMFKVSLILVAAVLFSANAGAAGIVGYIVYGGG